MFLDAREIMVGAQQDEGETFVVAQQDIIGWAITLDQLRLEQQRLCLAVRGDDRHAARQRDHPPQPVGQPINLRVVGDAVLECPRLSDIEHIAARIMHPVHAGFGWQRLQHIADSRHPAFQIGLVSTAHGVGLGLFVKARGRIWLVWAIGFGHSVLMRYLSRQRRNSLNEPQWKNHFIDRRHRRYRSRTGEAADSQRR
jgi:hypothetical protein